VYLLVLSLTAMLVAVGVTAVTVGRIDLQSTRLEEDQADARLLAHAMIEVVRLQLEDDDGWRKRYTNNTWTASYQVGTASYRFKLVDEQDGSLSDDPADPARLYVQADAGDASRVYSVVLRDGKTLTEALAVGASRDDAAEDGLLGVNTTAGSSIQIGDNGLVDGIAAVRFDALPVEPGELILVAEVQFTSVDSQKDATTITVWAEAADNAGPFSTGLWDIGNRDRTTTQTAWSPGAWEIEERAAAQRTPNLAALVQEVIDRPGWASGNAVAFFLEGTGVRNVRTRDHGVATAPVLHLTYTAPGLSVDYTTLRRELAE
jgi:hypothetical protein